VREIAGKGTAALESPGWTYGAKRQDSLAAC